MDARIRDVLSAKGTAVHSVESTATVFDAVAMMNERRVGSVLVVEGERLVGILSERDVLMRVVPEGLDVHETRVRDVMTRDVHTARPESGIREVMLLMTERRVRHVPVVDDDQVVGLISIGDLTKWASQDLKREVYDLSSYIVGAYVVRPFLA
jgi:CBS domain-containing protein